MPDEDRTSRHARRQMAEFLRLLHDALGQPPLYPPTRRVLVGVVQLLGDDHLGRRVAAREALADLIEAYGGDRP